MEEEFKFPGLCVLPDLPDEIIPVHGFHQDTGQLIVNQVLAFVFEHTRAFPVDLPDVQGCQIKGEDACLGIFKDPPVFLFFRPESFGKGRRHDPDRNEYHEPRRGDGNEAGVEVVEIIDQEKEDRTEHECEQHPPFRVEVHKDDDG